MTSATPTPTRPLPRFPEPDTEPFWRATREHRLTYQTDPDTGEVVSTTRRRPSTPWQEAAGTGTIYSYTVIRQHGQAYFRGRLPYVVAFVDLDEGLRILAEVSAPPEAIHIGQRVAVSWEDHDEVSVPIFRPLETA